MPIGRSPASTTSASSRGSATASRASRSASAAAPRSCRGSRRPSTSSSRPTNGDFLKVSEAVFRIFDRQDWLRVNRARARIKVLVDKIGMDAFREMVDRELEGDWVAERDFTVEHLLGTDDEERRAPGKPESPGSPNGDGSRVRGVLQGQRPPAASGGLQHGRRQGHPRRPDPGAVPRPRPPDARLHGRQRADDDRAELRPALGPRRGALRRLRGPPASSASPTPAPARSPTP